MIVATMDGTRTVDTLWTEAAKRLGEEAMSQDAFIRFVTDLHAADLLIVAWRRIVDCGGSSCMYSCGAALAGNR